MLLRINIGGEEEEQCGEESGDRVARREAINRRSNKLVFVTNIHLLRYRLATYSHSTSLSFFLYSSLCPLPSLHSTTAWFFKLSLSALCPSFLSHFHL
ncbi:hypothetical protein VNO78_05213 [Psophocarpus tetragonolobus]|uniref:Uncharacterized protein n=1 Tax=Psophocarpus tetragonolobus TaxID=3891 RepID=A0AAN9STE7_PSOTE